MEDLHSYTMILAQISSHSSHACIQPKELSHSISSRLGQSKLHTSFPCQLQSLLYKSHSLDSLSSSLCSLQDIALTLGTILCSKMDLESHKLPLLQKCSLLCLALLSCMYIGDCLNSFQCQLCQCTTLLETRHLLDTQLGSLHSRQASLQSGHCI